MQNSFSIPDINIGRAVDGYVVNTFLDPELQSSIEQLQVRLVEKYKDNMWLQPLETLHITLMDWLAPLVEYPQAKNKVYRRIYPIYDRTLEEILAEQQPINLSVQGVEVSSASIFVRFVDGGHFQAIREGFLDKITLEAGTKRPPQIVHATIARFTGEVVLDDVRSLIAQAPVTGETTVGQFRLVHETKSPMLESEVIKSYLL